MKAERFVKSWSALWLWMHELNKTIISSQCDEIYTFRKARLDLHFVGEDHAYNLSWEKRGNQASLIGSTQITLPKRHIDIFKLLPPDILVTGASIHRVDRLLKISMENGYCLIFGFYHAALNIYLYQSNQLLQTFLKQPDQIKHTDDWLGPMDPLPTSLPGSGITADELRRALDGIWLSPDDRELTFGSSGSGDLITIQELVINSLKQGQKPKESPSVSLEKTGRTVLQRWNNKLKNIQVELLEAESWPKLEVHLQALQIGMGMGEHPQNGQLDLPAELSPTGEPFRIALPVSNSSLQQEVEATAKKIRKFKGKLQQLSPIPDKIKSDINKLEVLLQANNFEELKAFLKEQGETLDKSGYQKTERKPYKKYASPNGFDILIGRSSSDNDTLTFKVAGKNDWWFHARQVRGSHVILRTGNQTPQTADIRRAAEYAAQHSKAKHSGIVVVQYCQRKHLSKPKGSHPGAVLVHHEKAITVDLDRLR